LLAQSPADVAVLWRLARAQVDLAKTIKGEHEYTRGVRDSVYGVAREFAQRAVATDSTEAEAHFMVSLALGELSRTRGGKERVRFARTIYDEAARALALDSLHDGAHHVLGAWHAEVKRLSGLTRFFAKTLFGAGFMDRAHWDSAVVHLERAVALNPTYIHHRLELAQVYVDRARWAEARAQLDTIPGLPDRDVLDGDHRRAAAELLEKIKGR
jgi:lipopolysaccharide biosynthesis regulator YciM